MYFLYILEQTQTMTRLLKEGMGSLELLDNETFLPGLQYSQLIFIELFLIAEGGWGKPGWG